MKRFQWVALAALLVGPAAAQDEAQMPAARPLAPHLERQLGLVDAGRTIATLPPDVTRLGEVAYGDGILLAWERQCPHSAQTRAQVEALSTHTQQDLMARPEAARQWMLGIAHGVQHTFAQMPPHIRCDMLARQVLEVLLR